MGELGEPAFEQAVVGGHGAWQVGEHAFGLALAGLEEMASKWTSIE